jgi:hypothetical protein
MHLFRPLILALLTQQIGQIVHAHQCVRMFFTPALSRSARVLVEASLPPARTCPEMSFLELGTQPPIPTMRPNRIKPNV